MNKMFEEIIKIAELPLKWQKLNNKTILISGGTGFIGSWIIDVIKYRNEKYNSGIKVVCPSRHRFKSDSTVEYIEQDITNPIVYNGNVDYIMHLASNTHPKQYFDDPVGTITTNIIGCNNLLKVAKEKNVKRFLLASSVEIYGQGMNTAMTEDYCGYIDCNNARNGYNESKRTCESLCQSYKQQYEIDFVTVRLARVFGPDKKEDTKAISQFIDKAVNNKDIVLNSTGMQRYSFLYIADAVSGIFHVLLNGTNGEAYNIAADDEGMTLGEYAEYIAQLSNKNVIYDIKKSDSVSNATFALLNTEKIKSIGWKPIYSVREGLKKTYNYLI